MMASRRGSTGTRRAARIVLVVLAGACLVVALDAAEAPELDTRSPRIPSEFFKSPVGLAEETPQQVREKEELLRLIERVQAIRLVRKKQQAAEAMEAVDTPEPDVAPPSEPNEAPVDLPPLPSLLPVAPSLPPVRVPPKPDPNGTVQNTVALLEAFSGRAEQFDKPFEMAELLWGSGYLPEAAVYYRVALQRMKAGDPGTKHQRAWALFQAGSCVRHTDPAEAGRMFQQLLNEHPDSSWKEAAATWLSLVDWYAREKPQELVASYKK